VAHLEGAATYGGALFVWWLALYVVTRGGMRRLPLLAAAALASLAAYLLGQALAALAADRSAWQAWQRWTWWGAAVAPALWLAVAARLAGEEGSERPGRTRTERLSALVVLVGAALGAAGSATDLVVEWSDAPAQPAGRLYSLFQAYLCSALLVALAIVARLWRRSPSGTPQRATFGWLTACGLLFLAGGAYGATANRLLGLPALPGEAALLVGAAVMGWSVARYGALLAGEVVSLDAVASGATTLAMAGLYGAALLIGPAPPPGWLERVLLLLPLVAASHLLVNARSMFLDRLLYGASGGALRGQLSRLAARATRQPDAVAALVEAREGLDQIVRAQEPDGWRVIVEGALRHLNDLPLLAGHPLTERLPPGRGGETALDRGGRLREELGAAIDRLRPGGSRPTPGQSLGAGGWLHHLVLYEAYVDGRPNKQVMQRYHLSEGTFHRARRRAIDALAADLRERWGD
jgi:hypothetical protein